VKVKIAGSLFEAEHAILAVCNEFRVLATSQTIKKFDKEKKSDEDSTAGCGKPHVLWCGRGNGRNPVTPTRSYLIKDN
jgi:hypothetical protein